MLFYGKNYNALQIRCHSLASKSLVVAKLWLFENGVVDKNECRSVIKYFVSKGLPGKDILCDIVETSDAQCS